MRPSSFPRPSNRGTEARIRSGQKGHLLAVTVFINRCIISNYFHLSWDDTITCANPLSTSPCFGRRARSGLIRVCWPVNGSYRYSTFPFTTLTSFTCASSICLLPRKQKNDVEGRSWFFYEKTIFKVTAAPQEQSMRGKGRVTNQQKWRWLSEA